MPHDTTTTRTGAHLATSKTTSMRKRTSWPLVCTFTTSTSRMENATCSINLNLVHQHRQYSVVQHPHSLNGLVNLEPTSTSSQFEHIDLLYYACDAEQPLTTSWSSRQQLVNDNTWRCSVYVKHVKTCKPSLQCLQETIEERQLSSTATSTRFRMTSVNNNDSTASPPPPQYVVQKNFLDDSQCTTRSQTVSRTKRFRRLQRTNIGWEIYRQVRHQYAAGTRVQQYTLLQSVVHPEPRWTETSQQEQQFRELIRDVSADETLHPVINDTFKVNTVINNLCGPILHNNIYYFVFDHIILGLKYVRWSTTSFPTTIRTSQSHSRQHRPGRQVHQRKKRRQKRKERKHARPKATTTTKATAATTATTTNNNHSRRQTRRKGPHRELRQQQGQKQPEVR